MVAKTWTACCALRWRPAREICLGVRRVCVRGPLTPALSPAGRGGSSAAEAVRGPLTPTLSPVGRGGVADGQVSSPGRQFSCSSRLPVVASPCPSPLPAGERSPACGRVRGLGRGRACSWPPHPGPLPGRERGRCGWAGQFSCSSLLLLVTSHRSLPLLSVASPRRGEVARLRAGEGLVRGRACSWPPHPSPLPGGERGVADGRVSSPGCHFSRSSPLTARYLSLSVISPRRGEVARLRAGEGAWARPGCSWPPHPGPLPGGERGRCGWAVRGLGLQPFAPPMAFRTTSSMPAASSL